MMIKEKPEFPLVELVFEMVAAIAFGVWQGSVCAGLFMFFFLELFCEKNEIISG